MVKRLVSELGVELESKVTSVTVTPANSYGTTTEFVAKCVRWIAQSWLEIQDDQQDWDFMRTKGVFDLVEGQAQYEIPLQVDLADYDGLRPFVAPVQSRYILIADGAVSPMQRNHCYYVQPELYFGHFDRLEIAPGLPYRYTFTSNGCILFDPAPGKDSYKAEFRYRRLPQEFVEDTDTPTGLPPKFHMLIVYRAMGYYSGFDETEPQMARAVRLDKRMMNKLRIEQLPEYMVPGNE